MTRASPDLMDLLHGLVATGLREELERALERAALPKDHENYEPIPPQLLDKAIKFLKDNAITAPASNKPLNDLAQTLADLDLDDEAVRLRTAH